MNIYFSPISMFAELSLEVSGGDLIVNGVHHSVAALAAIPDDQAKPEFIVSATPDSVTVLLPYWGEPSEAVAFPQPVIDAPDGAVELPQ